MMKLEKEIMDIEEEQREISELLRKGEYEQLCIFLDQTISSKYLLEKAMYNCINTEQPHTLQENAKNAIAFLEKMKTNKKKELVYMKIVQ